MSRCSTSIVRRLALAGALVTGVHGAGAQVDPRIDPASGRHLAVWPPSVQFDYRHMTLVIDIPDMGKPFMTATETLTVVPIGSARQMMRLDCGEKIKIRNVTESGREVAFTHEGSVLTLKFGEALKDGATAEVKIEYDCDLAGNAGHGLTWSPGKEKGESETLRSPQLHSQGQAQHNHRWFPCHDFPNERLTTELIVTVEDGYEVSSNGSLVSKGSAGSGRTRWHWRQDQPHANYLVTLVVGKFATVDIGGDVSARPGLPMKVYTAFGTEEQVRSVFADTPAMVAFFEKKFDEPYPWARYDQLIVRDFLFGGMENTSATTLYEAAENGDQDDLISHELMHQWFGDLITCKGWAHLWLNEGWASMGEALWREQEANLIEAAKAAGAADPEMTGTIGIAAREVAPASEAGRRAYQKSILGFLTTQRAVNRATAPAYPSLVSNYYRDADETIAKVDDVYAKGALLLHMLRTGLGDEVFTAGVKVYLDRFKFKFAETDDFRKCLEEVSGQSLERFFDQWAMRPGLPRLDVDVEYDEAAKKLKVAVEQVQHVDADNPAYRFTLPVYLKYDHGGYRFVYVDVNAKKVEATFDVARKPLQTSIDPNLTVMAFHRVRKPMAMWVNELREGPSVFAQVSAAEHLGLMDGDEASSALARAMVDAELDGVVREAATRASVLGTARRVCGAFGLGGAVGAMRRAGGPVVMYEIAGSKE